MSKSSDPRTIITPDAFSVAPELLGTPLSSPSRRLLALLADLILIGFVQLLGGTVLGLVAAVVFLGMALRRGGKSERNLNLRSVFLGCTGFLILGLTVLVAVVVPTIFDSGSEIVAAIDDEGEGARGLGALVAGAMEMTEFLGARTEEEKIETGIALGRRMIGAGATIESVESAIEDLLPDDSDLDGEEILAQVMARMTEVVPDDDEEVPVSDEIMPALDRALESYAEILRSPDDDARGASNALALRAQIADAVAGDTIDALRSRVANLRSNLDLTQDSLEQSQALLAQRSEPATVFAWVRDAADEAGLIFGWGTIYLTVFLAGWDGRTPGKKLFGIRVVRLSGDPMSWFMAFERAAGYVAGFATGLLGFAQVYWDSNRQAIHDKIARTVVVRDGAARRKGRWAAGPDPSSVKAPRPSAKS